MHFGFGMAFVAGVVIGLGFVGAGAVAASNVVGTLIASPPSGAESLAAEADVA